jgi:hypothetical protein
LWNYLSSNSKAQSCRQGIWQQRGLFKTAENGIRPGSHNWQSKDQAGMNGTIAAHIDALTHYDASFVKYEARK